MNDLFIAPLWKRIIAFAIDISIIVGLIVLLIPLVNWILQLPIEYSITFERGVSVEMTDYVNENFYKLVLIYSLVKISIVASYFVFSESSCRQATFGKKIFNLKVGDSAGKRISVKRAILRLFGKWISGQILMIGYLMAFFTKNKQALHDILARTFVFENSERK